MANQLISDAEPSNTAKTLRAMADTFDERNAVYKGGHDRVGAVLLALHGTQSPAKLSVLLDEGAISTGDAALFSLYLEVIKKLVRFADSGLTHVDSIHDAGVYCAMVETKLKEILK